MAIDFPDPEHIYSVWLKTLTTESKELYKVLKKEFQRCPECARGDLRFDGIDHYFTCCNCGSKFYIITKLKHIELLSIKS